jgi:transposase-like protein
MEKDRLARMIDAGWSLDRIGREVGVHASTVAYWVRKHGLAAANQERHSPKGGLRREPLAQLVEAGSTLSSIAATLGVSTATVRYWLERYDLCTAGAARRRQKASTGTRPRYALRTCRAHGETRFVLEARGYYRCMRCRVEQVSRRRRKAKRILVAEAGGSCRLCGYDRHPAALEFHHLDPATKAFNLSLRGETRGIDELRAEARKCVLLCANCHAEVEAGFATLPATPGSLLDLGQEKGRLQAA